MCSTQRLPFALHLVSFQWLYVFEGKNFSLVQFSSVAQSCLTLCDPMNRSMPGLPVHHRFFLCAIIKCKVHLVYKPNCIFISSSQEWCPVFPSAYVFQHSTLTQFKGLIVLPVKADVWGTRVVIFSAPDGFVGWSDWQGFGVDMSSLLSFFYSMESVWGARTAWLSSHWCLAKGESNLPILAYCDRLCCVWRMGWALGLSTASWAVPRKARERWGHVLATLQCLITV